MPSIATVRPYEAVYILDPDSGEEQIHTVTSKYRQLVENQGGTVEKIDVWERRKLAYEIKGRTEGIYVVMNFSGAPSVEAELRRIFQISEDQIRAMIVRPEETDAPAARPERVESAPAAAPAAVPVAAPAAPVVAPAAAPVAAAEQPDPATAAATPVPVTDASDAGPTA